MSISTTQAQARRHRLLRWTSAPRSSSQTWSPDNKWIAYTKQLPSGQHAVFVYSLDQAKAFQITDGMSDALYPAWDKNGKYLYFTASTNIALATAGLDMSSDEHRVTRSVYVAVLSKDEKSPLAPESDEEKPKDEAKSDQDKDKTKDAAPKNKGKDKSKKSDEAPQRQDKEKDTDKDKEKKDEARRRQDRHRGHRPAHSFSAHSRKELPQHAGGQVRHPVSLPKARWSSPKTISRTVSQTIQKFDLSKRKVDKFWKTSTTYAVSFDGEKILYRKGESWATASPDDAPGGSGGGPAKPGFGPLKLDGWEVYVEPRAMWKQIYNETWRIERDFFYDPHYHGLDLDKAKKKYAPYLDGIASRDELTYLFEECLGEMTVGHMFVGGGEATGAEEVKGRTARRRLQSREQSISRRQGLQRRELESRQRRLRSRSRAST